MRGMRSRLPVTVWAVCMMRDEEDVAQYVVQHMLDEQVDGLIVADNLSTDRTRGILDSFTDSRLTIIDDDDVAYRQDEKMTALGCLAMEQGADWVLPFDADEWWYSLQGPIGEVLANLVSCDVLKTYGHDHRATSSDDPDDLNPFTRMQWREVETQKFPKVCYRFHPDARLHLGNHDIDMPGRRDQGLLGYRHFGYRSLEQMARKVRQGAEAVEAANLGAGHATHWRQYAAMTDEELEVAWKGFVDMPGLVHDPCPR